MSVKELIELLSKLDQDKEVTLYDGEWESNNPINRVEVVGKEIVLY
jgi:hypothetical protein